MFRPKMDQPNPSEKDIKVLIPGPTSHFIKTTPFINSEIKNVMEKKKSMEFYQILYKMRD